jgi:hypothetical protein
LDAPTIPQTVCARLLRAGDGGQAGIGLIDNEVSVHGDQRDVMIVVAGQSEGLALARLLRDLLAALSFFAGALTFFVLADAAFAFLVFAVTVLTDLVFAANDTAFFFDFTAAVLTGLLFLLTAVAGWDLAVVFVFFAAAFGALVFLVAPLTIGTSPKLILETAKSSGQQLPAAYSPDAAEEDGGLGEKPGLQWFAESTHFVPLY